MAEAMEHSMEPKTSKKTVNVRSYDVTFQNPRKVPATIEKAINEILALGKFLGAQQIENPSTGRLYYSLMIDESNPADTKAKVFREYQPEVMQEKVNEFIIKSGYKQQTWSTCGKSNVITKTVFGRR